MRPEMWAMISWPFSRRTRKVVLGNVSMTVPSNSMESSFDMRFQICAGGRKAEHFTRDWQEKAKLC